MSLAQIRGGIPLVFRDSIDTTGRKHDPKKFVNYIVARNKGANVVNLFFTEDDFDADANFVELPVAAATAPYGEWSGPVEAEAIWLKAVGGASAVEVVLFQRRG